MQLEAKKNKLKNAREANNDAEFGGSSQFATGLFVRDLAEENDTSKDEIYRYIRLTFLIRELLELVDEEKIPFVAGVDLSYLSEEDQMMVLDQMNMHNIKIDLKKAKALKELSQAGRLSEEKIYRVLMGEEKKPKPKGVKLKPKLISKFFRPDQKPKEIEEIIEEALTLYFETKGGIDT
jgi:ParB family chromosome partitioning protein